MNLCDKCGCIINYEKGHECQDINFQKILSHDGLKVGSLGRVYCGYDTYRLKVAGGWIIKNISYEGNQRTESMCFIPDPNHEWKI